jgi:hypothetical protein
LTEKSQSKEDTMINRRRWLASCTIGLPVPAILASARAAEPIDEGWIDFVNGRDMSFWKRYGDSQWRVEDGILICETEENAPRTRVRSQAPGKWGRLPGHFQDAEIELEVRFTGNVDAAIVPRKGGLRLWLGTCGRDPANRTGCWYTGKDFPESGLAQDVEKLWKQDDWNAIRILAKAGRFTAWINGHQVSELEGSDEAFPHNHIELVTGPGKKMKLEIRNLRARRL